MTPTPAATAVQSVNFFTSAGFGGLAAVVAAVIAVVGLYYRAKVDRGLARDSEARQRWWDAAMWVADHAQMPVGSRIGALVGLARLAVTEEQVLILKAIRDTINAAPGAASTTPSSTEPSA